MKFLLLICFLFQTAVAVCASDSELALYRAELSRALSSNNADSLATAYAHYGEYYAYRDAGGGAPNVVQDHAALYYFIRAPKVSQAVELRERVDNCARGAALMSGTTVEITTTDGLCDFIPNRTLRALLQQGMEAVFGRECCRRLAIRPCGAAAVGSWEG